ncbi:unnamed protein product [Strongylus vulgaris]|uniref:Uncharacterized protein n=1 Tax=Strongylus vulgaris TaxID=40348 RepID=A0A3P7L140_STRVU|nr:unnamed protein product [Strongylus vulgaris]
MHGWQQVLTNRRSSLGILEKMITSKLLEQERGSIEFFGTGHFLELSFHLLVNSGLEAVSVFPLIIGLSTVNFLDPFNHMDYF